MKILFLNYEYPPLGGGGGIALMEFAEALASEHEVHVLTSGAPGQPDTEKHNTLNLTVHRTPVMGRSARATASFLSMATYISSGIKTGKALMRDIQFDVINTWFAIPTGPVGTALSSYSGVPNVLTIIGGDIYDPSKWYSPHKFLPSRLVAKRVISKATTIAAISTDIVGRAREFLNMEREATVIPLGITEPEFNPVSRAQLGLSEDKQYITAVGRLVRRKDYPTLIRALKETGRDDAELLLLGDGPERENLEKLAGDLGLADRVHLKGFVSNEEKYQYLSNADIFALVSLHEGFGIVYLEAMYCGLPIIAADEGGQTDILEDPASGSLVPVGDVEALTSALNTYLENAELSSSIASKNEQRFERFAIKSLANQYLELFQATIDGENKAKSA